MKKFFVILFLLLGMKIFADEGSVQGNIEDDSGEPLWGANVYLLNTSFGASTEPTWERSELESFRAKTS